LPVRNAADIHSLSELSPNTGTIKSACSVRDYPNVCLPLAVCSLSQAGSVSKKLARSLEGLSERAALVRDIVKLDME
jgi:hypothetical protein